MATHQALSDLGINPFAATLLSESFLRSRACVVVEKQGIPMRFCIDVNREDCKEWDGVEITIKPIRRTPSED